MTVEIRMLDIGTVEAILKSAAAHNVKRGFRPMTFAACDSHGHLMYLRRRVS